MELTKQVVYLELAKRLKELGVKQESYFYWVRGADSVHGVWNIVAKDKLEEIIGEGWTWLEEAQHRGDAFAAFTVAELGEMLPKTFEEDGLEYELCCFYQDSKWCVMYMRVIRGGVRPGVERMDGTEIEEANTEADARAKMLIYLVENNLLKP